MTATDGFDRLLDSWLESSAAGAPAGFHDGVMDRARRLRPRPRWLAVLRTEPAFSGGLIERASGATRFAAYVGLLILCVLLAAVVIFVAGSMQRRVPPPFGPAANGSLVYERAGDIYLADPSGRGETLIAGGPTGQSAPSWSRDGRQFAYIRLVGHHLEGSGIVAVDANGHNSRLLTTPSIATPESFDWSPDGSTLAIINWQGGRRVISIVAADGSLRGRTLDLGEVDPFSFGAWRPPNGAEVIFVGHPVVGSDERALYAVSPDGSDLRELARDGNQSDPALPGPVKLSFQNPSLSADGSKLMFWDWEPGLVDGRDGSIHVIDLATGRDQRMSFDPTASTELVPVLSPDGSNVVFERQDSDGLAQLMVSPADGSGRTVGLGPVFSYAVTHDFVVSPDGSTILLIVEGATPVRIDVTTGGVTRMEQAITTPPSWQRLAP